MTNTRILYLDRWRNGLIYQYGTRHPQFPPENTQNDSRADFWRTRYGANSGNGMFEVVATNKYLDFDEGGSELTAVIAEGTYSGQGLATAVTTALNATVGKALTYACVYTETSAIFTFVASATFTLRWNTGTHKATDCSDLLGFSDAANDTGCTGPPYYYDGDYRRIHSGEYIRNDLLSAVEINCCALLGHNIQAGATIYVQYCDTSGGSFTTTASTTNITPGDHVFFFTAATHRYWQVAVLDPTNPNAYIQVAHIALGKYADLSRPLAPPFARGYDDHSETVLSDSLNLFANKRPRIEGRNIAFQGLSETSANEIISLLEECGETDAWLLCLDSSAPNTNSYWIRLASVSYPQYQRANYWNWQAAVKEVR